MRRVAARASPAASRRRSRASARASSRVLGAQHVETLLERSARTRRAASFARGSRIPAPGDRRLRSLAWRARSRRISSLELGCAPSFASPAAGRVRGPRLRADHARSCRSVAASRSTTPRAPIAASLRTATATSARRSRSRASSTATASVIGRQFRQPTNPRAQRSSRSNHARRALLLRLERERRERREPVRADVVAAGEARESPRRDARAGAASGLDAAASPAERAAIPRKHHARDRLSPSRCTICGSVRSLTSAGREQRRRHRRCASPGRKRASHGP